MAMEQCPGQDKRFWKAGDIFEAPCPHCGGVIEFWKDDLRRRCRKCGKKVANPRLDLGSARLHRHDMQARSGFEDGRGEPVPAQRAADRVDLLL